MAEKPARADLAPEALATEDDLEWLDTFIEMEAASDERFTFAADDIDALRRILKSAALARRPAPDLRALAAKWRGIADALTPDAPGLEPTSAASIRTCKRLHEEHAAELEALAAEMEARDG